MDEIIPTGNNGSKVEPALRGPLVPQAHGGALRPIRKGEVLNPTGRPKRLFGDAYTRLAKRRVPDGVRSRLRKRGIELPERASMADAVAAGMHAAAIAGYAPPAKEIADRVEGRVPDRTEITGAAGAPLQIEVAVIHIGGAIIGTNGDHSDE